MVELSILLNTVREDYPLIGLPDTFIFEPTCRSLNKQELQNFELVIVDGCYSKKREKFLAEHAWFPHKYVNAEPNRWLSHGMVATATMKNKGLLYCEGELVVFVDDCTMFPPWWTKRISGWFRRGFWPMSLTYYFEAGKPKLLGKSSRYVERFYGRNYDKEENLYVFLKPGEVVRDSRADVVNAHGVVKAPGNWFYGGSSASLEALLSVNGLDEKFDGKKGLEDVDLGLRLEQAGYKGMFVLDKKVYHVENWHESLSQRVLHYKGPTPACNYALLLYNKNHSEPKANTHVLSHDNCEWIRNKICSTECNNYQRCLKEEFQGRFYVEGEGYETWLRLQRTFDLREMRLDL